MAKQTHSLNATQLVNLKPKEKEYNVTDGNGLFLRVKPTGTKIWIYNYYHPRTKKRKNQTIGIYPHTSLAKARQAREEYRGLLELDIDPKEHLIEQKRLAEEKDNDTFHNVAIQWMEIKRSQIKPDSANKIWRSLELDVFPRIGDMPVTKISAPIAIEIIKSITGRNSFEVARKVARRLNSVFTFAVNTGLIQHNPLAGIKEVIPSTKVINQPTISPSELPELMRELNFASIRFATRCLIEWQLHTMVRPGEAVQTRWDEIDFDNKIWIIPAERMKMDKEHQIPLSTQALAILELMKLESGHREFVFPSINEPRKPANKETANMAIKRMGFKGRLVAHGLRALASTTLNEEGFEPDVIEAALAHADKNKIRGAYNRATYLDKRKVMMQWWSDHIEQSATGSMTVTNLTIPIRKRA